MKRTSTRVVIFCFWLICNLLLGSFTRQAQAQSSQGAVPDATELLALRQLYQATNGSQWANHTGWPATSQAWDGATVTSAAGWAGVTVANGDVTAIDLNGNNLQGMLPASLGGLTQLTYLNLPNCPNLTGPLPASIGQLRNLTYLRTTRSPFTGPLPPEMAQLVNLVYLYLGESRFSGPLPTWLGGLSKLEDLDLVTNRFTGPIPKELASLAQLRSLTLGNQYYIQPGEGNVLTGGIPPELGRLTNLSILDLSLNPIGGEIPKELGQLTNLTFLELDDCHMQGAIPAEVLRLPQLSVLILGSYNQNYHDFNRFNSLPDPAGVPNLVNLALNLQYNQFDFGTLEPYFSGPGQMRTRQTGGYNYSAPRYQPQTLPQGEQTVATVVGQRVTIASGIGGVHTHYQWQRQTGSNWVDVAGATAATYAIPAVSQADAGRYRCQATNEWVTNVTLYSQTTVLQLGNALPPDNPDENRDRNWTLERSYDGNGNVVAESKQFTDGLGRATQAQARNAAIKQVFAAQTIYNTGGQPVLQTLAAPTYNQSFAYKEGFVTAGGNTYGPANFEDAKANQPDAVDATQRGTLGYYFSQLNAQEPLTPATSYPYSLAEPYTGPLGGTRRAAGPGDELRMGKGREAKGREFMLRKEFDAYLSLRPQFVPGSPLTTLEYQGTKAVSVNADGRESIVVSNKEGQALVSCLSGPSYPALPVVGYLSAEDTHPVDPDAPVYSDIHLPAAGPQPVKFSKASSAVGSVRIINLLSDASYDYPVSSASSVTPAAGSYGYTTTNDATTVTLPPGFYRFVSLAGTQLTAYEAHYGNFSYTYYDEAGRAVATIAPKGLENNPSASTPLTYVTRNTYDAQGQLLATESSDEGRSEYVYAQDGRIRFSQSALQRPAGRFSYSHYDEAGRVVESGEYTPATSPSPPTQSPSTGQGYQSPQYGAWDAKVATTNAVVYPNCCVGSMDAQGKYVEFTVQAPQAGTYSLTLNYASGNPDRTLSLLANGALVRPLTFPRTDTYQWKTYLTLTTSVTLQAGTNKLRVEYRSGDSGGVNIAYIQFTGSAAATTNPITYLPLVDQLPPATASTTTSPGFQSPQYGAWDAKVATTNAVVYPNCCVGSLDAQGKYVEFTVQAPQAGTYTLTLNYASGNPDRTLSLLANGTLVRQLTFPRTDTYQWKTYLNTTTAVTLQAGTNKLRVEYRSGDSGGVNIAYVQFAGTTTSTSSSGNLVEERMPTNSLDVTRCAQRNQVWYDLPFDGTAGSQGNNSQLNGRHQEFVVGAVAKTKNDNVTTWYSYDELGRVTWVVQDIVGVGVKTLDYQYDFSGNVLQVAYQKGQPDAFYHYYSYDAAQRLTSVSTSTDGVTMKRQADYSYYLHGPLKRVQVAGDLQGVDYVYTLQGALKSINHTTSALEPGQDSPYTNGVYKDLFAFTLEYFSGDYRSRDINVPAPPLPPGPGAPVADRFDGTIRSASWRTAARPDIQRMAYTYDEKSQLQNSTYSNWQLFNNAYQLNATSTNSFQEGGLRYDVNGNIQSLKRTGATGATTDDFVYKYKPATNQLAEVHTGSASGATVLDYDYDELGQLTRQRDEQGQRYFTYDVTGKTTGVYRDAAHQQPVVTFAYDDRGFRVRKTAYATGGAATTTTYVRDVAGNILAIYSQATAGGPWQRTEVPFYGSGRLGTLTHLDDGTTAGSDDYRYELTDHLGDARVVFHRPTATTEVETLELSGVSGRASFLNADRYRVPASNAPSGDYVARLTNSQAPGQELKRERCSKRLTLIRARRRLGRS